MKCTSCGNDLEVRREAHRYDSCGLPGVVLSDVEIRKCVSCGDEEVLIPGVSKLHAAIAKYLVTKETRLNGGEVKYLRKYLGWSGVDFAQHMGVDAATVSRWESNTQPISATGDRLLRVCVVHEKPIENYSIDSLTRIEAKRRDSETRIKLSHGANSSWRPEGAEAS